mmetsp:Transcript_62194/g.131421  ORF Transcript_62194/g.131421 Transcript_62194/m.131421 type:complete len:149 (+) Transcript_62194:233-679(+)|eukprot:CAMPEP_0206574474 /NCGR_PEP_ID=MMETSP0325_2-20121206/29469_1 /ASSEMBLY_ACC=CAM_ASM_000347 /TAXON_ID=2866 /ORGANISM="Crypthecodinium cohnii, Strain Seligo" /LENGTH=148 /DNA_ID=CAMNT_0054079089 /DNA_START=185 /DNA_END=631 /DNA_ORIENTATION=-
MAGSLVRLYVVALLVAAILPASADVAVNRDSEGSQMSGELMRKEIRQVLHLEPSKRGEGWPKRMIRDEEEEQDASDVAKEGEGSGPCARRENSPCRTHADCCPGMKCYRGLAIPIRELYCNTTSTDCKCKLKEDPDVTGYLLHATTEP